MADKTPTGENTTKPVVTDPAPAPAPAADPAPVVLMTPPAPTDPAPAGDPAPIPEIKYDLKIGNTPVNSTLIEALTPIFKKAGISQENAQELATAYETTRVAMIPKTMERDLETLKADKELGGVNLIRTQTRVNSALTAFTTPQERKQLTDLGIANNPTLVRMFHRIGKSMGDTPSTEPGPQPGQKVPRQTKLYGGGDLVQSGGKHN